MGAWRQYDGLRVEVGDTNPRLPVLADPCTHAESGRGLRIVATLARRWGTDRADEGKIVWFEI